MNNSKAHPNHPHTKRSKTQKKQSPNNTLPTLNPSKRLITLDLNDHCAAKKRLSEKFPRKDLTRKDLSDLKRIQDENMWVGSAGKGQYRYSKKKVVQPGFLLIHPIYSKMVTTQLRKNVISVATDQHRGLRDTNEDRMVCVPQFEVEKKIFSFFAVFDGHGGSAVSQYLKENLHKQFCALAKLYNDKNVGEILRMALSQIEDEVAEKKLTGGSCASILIIHSGKYYIVHLGDSRILKLKLNKCDHSLIALQQLTADHKPDQQKQKKRIESFGGKVYRSKILVGKQQIFGPFRLLPGRLSVSRSIGDTEIKRQGNSRILIAEPELLEGTLNEKEIFILMSDGAYEKFNNEEIASHFSKIKSGSGNCLKRPLQTFFVNSILKESSDNISMACILTQSV